MDKYYIVDEKNHRVHIIDVGAESWDGNWWEKYFPKTDPLWIRTFRVYQTTPQGVPYFWELAGPGGAYFILFFDKDATREQVEEAKSYLRNNQDVVDLDVMKLERVAA